MIAVLIALITLEVMIRGNDSFFVKLYKDYKSKKDSERRVH